MFYLVGKYFHPQKEDGREIYVFCHDFQNNGCLRIGCKFIHCSAQDEDYYNKTGELLPHVYEAYRKIVDSLNEVGPVCKDYFKGGLSLENFSEIKGSSKLFRIFHTGKCERDMCRYRHLSDQENLLVEEKHQSKSLGKVNNIRKSEECNFCQISFEYKHCRNEYEDHICDCKRRRRNYCPEVNLRNCDTSDNRKLWVKQLLLRLTF